jgi:hypothetical protein
MGLLAFLTGPVREVLKLIGRSFRDWSEWSVREPRAAAAQLRLIAAVFEARSRHRKRPDGYLARMDAATAEGLRAQAKELLASAGDAARLRTVCAVAPGSWTPSASSSTP